MNLKTLRNFSSSALLALLGTCATAHAGEILFVNAIDTVHGGIATYSYTQDGSGNFSAATRTLVTNQLRNSNWLVQGPNNTVVPYMWQTDAFAGITQYSGTGAGLLAGTPNASLFNQAQSVEDASGNAYARNLSNQGIVKIAANGVGSSIVSTGGNGLAIGPDGFLYSAQSGIIQKYSTSGMDLGQFGTITGGTPTQLAFDSHGNLFGLVNNTSIVKWAADGTWMGVFKSGLPNTLGGGRSQDPNTFAIDSHDNIFLAQGYGSLYQISPSGTVTTIDGLSNNLQMFSVAVLDVAPSATPEPSTGLLFLSAGGFLIWGGRRFRKAPRTDHV